MYRYRFWCVEASIGGHQPSWALSAPFTVRFRAFRFRASAMDPAGGSLLLLPGCAVGHYWTCHDTCHAPCICNQTSIPGGYLACSHRLSFPVVHRSLCLESPLTGATRLARLGCLSALTQVTQLVTGRLDEEAYPGVRHVTLYNHLAAARVFGRHEPGCSSLSCTCV
jgi:hypothetical protein